MVKTILGALSLLAMLSCSTAVKENTAHPDIQPGMCAKEPMTADGIVRLSKIEVFPQYLDNRGGRNFPAHRTGRADDVCCRRKGKSL